MKIAGDTYEYEVDHVYEMDEQMHFMTVTTAGGDVVWGCGPSFEVAVHSLHAAMDAWEGEKRNELP